MNDDIGDCLIGRAAVLPGRVMDQTSTSGKSGDKSGDQGGERIAKVIARAGLASRREAEAWIAAGRVAVNGAVITSPALNVTANDSVSVDGEKLPVRERTRLFLYRKPRGVVTTHADPQGRPTIFQNLPRTLPRVISVGRLDFNTEGLILLTNDGALARVLELPSTGWLRRYRVRAHGAVTQASLNELRKGVTVDGVHYGDIDATLDRVQSSNAWLTFSIREGKNREVRNVLGHLGLTVTRLIRIAFGPFDLGELGEGAVEEVPTRKLRERLGERVVALSGADFSAPLRHDGSDDDMQEPETAASPRVASPLAAPQLAAEHRPSRDERRERRSRTTPDDAAQSPPRESRKARPTSVDHSWRPPEFDRPGKKLRRKFHGARNDAGSTPVERTSDKKRAGLLTDRKGRRVLVERFGQPPAPTPPQERLRQERPQKESSQQDRPRQERPFKERGFKERPRQERPSGERPRQEQPFKGREFKEPPRQERPARERSQQARPFKERGFKERPREERPAQERPRQERPFKERGFKERPRQERPAQERQQQERPFKERGFKEHPRQERPSGERPRQERPFKGRPHKPSSRPGGDRPRRPPRR
jgi:23S rRNA pseudouridine2605 synthase